MSKKSQGRRCMCVGQTCIQALTLADIHSPAHTHFLLRPFKCSGWFLLTLWLTERVTGEWDSIKVSREHDHCTEACCDKTLFCTMHHVRLHMPHMFTVTRLEREFPSSYFLRKIKTDNEMKENSFGNWTEFNVHVRNVTELCMNPLRVHALSLRPQQPSPLNFCYSPTHIIPHSRAERK